jgi:uncharacterized protein YabE (DUF348 family)
MKNSAMLSRRITKLRYVTFLLVVTIFTVTACIQRADAAGLNESNERLITIHDRGNERVVLSSAATVADALSEADIHLDDNDAVEPARSQKLTSSSYTINIYRARPVIVHDGAVREKIMTPYQTADKIAQSAGVTLRDEDQATLAPSKDIIAQGAGLELMIDRAAPFTLSLYGKKSEEFTRADTVDTMLKEKGITISSSDFLSVSRDTPMTAGMTVELWRDGKQTVSVDQTIAYQTEKMYDMTRPIGYREIQTAGKDGVRTLVYEVEMKDGREIKRTEIQNIVSKEPQKQIEVVGLNPGNGLSRSKGANMFKDSKGVVHRETYYDLAMNVVMQNCGAGGLYTVRPDGAKVDKDGYVLIAANLNKYPRCSIVETSLGLGKVYDTGAFALKHPDGFDLATDWTNNDGR